MEGANLGESNLNILFLRKRGEFAYGGPLMFHEFEQAVGKIADCKWAGVGWPLHKPGETVDETVRRIYGNDPPDWVIDRESAEPLKSRRKYKVGHHLSDIHGRIGLGIKTSKDLLKLINRMEYDAVFMKAPYIYGLRESHAFFIKHLKPKWYILPYSVDVEKFKPLFPKEYDVMLVGSVAVRYPIRARAWNKLPDFCDQHGLRLLMKKEGPRPSWEAAKWENDPRYYIRNRYAEAVGRSHFFIFCGGIHGYPVQKYFEVPAAGCLSLTAPLRGIGKDLGFINRKTYVEIDKNSWAKEILYYRENEGEAQHIIDNGRRLICKRHTHDIRAQEFLKMLRGNV